MRWGLGPSKRSRPVPQSCEWLDGPKEVEDHTPMQRCPCWSHIRGLRGVNVAVATAPK